PMRNCLLLLGSCAVSFCLGSIISLGLFPAWQQRNCWRPASQAYLPHVELQQPLQPGPQSVKKQPRPSGDPLWSRVRIFCWVVTSPENHASKAYHVKSTWLSRCNGYTFMSTVSDPSLPSVALDVPEGRANLWKKTTAALSYLRRSGLLAKYDFFLKADDDTYVVIDNLRSLLADADPDEPLYSGRRFRPFVRQGYMSGGAGYVLSRAAVRKFVDLGLPSRDSACSGQFISEDVNLGSCMNMLGVHVLNSLDSLGRERFHPFQPEHHLPPGGIPPGNWLRRYNYYPLREGPECCSDTSISFHYVTPRQMYVLDFLIYSLKRPSREPHCSNRNSSMAPNSTYSTADRSDETVKLRWH
uniref:N-acetylgalactosaminide beta-1,3-galactosyltransferase n=2 Tax=Macrostomum lignano TaxID=282301 RepID=A0A1I8I5Y1_9PLAT